MENNKKRKSEFLERKSVFLDFNLILMIHKEKYKAQKSHATVPLSSDWENPAVHLIPQRDCMSPSTPHYRLKIPGRHESSA